MLDFDRKSFKGGIFLFLAALFWGSAFVAQKICKDYNSTEIVIAKDNEEKEKSPKETSSPKELA